METTAEGRAESVEIFYTWGALKAGMATFCMKPSLTHQFFIYTIDPPFHEHIPKI